MTVEEALAIVETVLAPIRLTGLQETIFRQTWQKQSYLRIARDLGYGEDYVKGVGAELWQILSQALGQRVSKHSIQDVLARYIHSASAGSKLVQSAAPPEQAIAPIQADWSEAVDVSIFYGRSDELATLEHWVIHDRCHLIALLGMGGIGKTALAAKLGEQIRHQFDYVVWRSLRDAPLVEATVAGLIPCAEQSAGSLPASLDELISRLVRQLNQYRCLVILDNAESILRSGERAGQYRNGFEGYGTLIRRVGESSHQSCLLLTSREKPKEVCLLQGQAGPVRCLQLTGLDPSDGQKILQAEGVFGTQAEQQELLVRYAGNPLAVRIAATTIQELFCGNISQFLEQGIGVFGDICDLLNQQFERLSELGRVVMYWLAINREPISLAELRQDLVSPILPQKLLETLESLERRSLLERSSTGFTLQNVVMEYVIDRLIEQVSDELNTKIFDLFNNYALIKATTKNYVRDTQIRLILKPILSQLSNTNEAFSAILSAIRNQTQITPGYATGNFLNLLRCQQQTIKDYDFSGLTIRQAYLEGMNLHNVSFAHSHFIDAVLTHTFGIVSSVAFSPDGTVLATGDSTGEIRLWHAMTGQYLVSYQGHKKWVRTIAFSPDGQLLASGGDDQTIRLWDVNTCHCLQTLPAHTNWIWSIAFSPDGQLLASSSDDRTIRLWSLENYHCLHVFQGHAAQVGSIAFSPDGQWLASGGAQIICIWDLTTYQCLHTLQGHTSRIRSVTFSPDGQRLASGSEDHTIRLWDLQRFCCLHVFQGHTGWVWSVAFSPDGETLASSSNDHTIRLWDINSRQCVFSLQGHTNRVYSIAFSPDGKTLASSSEDQTIRLWDLKHHQCRNILQGYTNQVCSVAFSANGQTLASGDERTIRLWDVKSRQCLQVLQGHTNRIWSVAFAPLSDVTRDENSSAGPLLASGSEDQTIRLWDLKTGQCMRVLQGHTSWIWSVAFSPSGQKLASGSEDQTVRLWDVQTGQCLRILQGHNNWVMAVVFSPNGQILASGGEDKLVRLWDLKTGQCVQILQGHTNQIWSIVFTPDGKQLVSSSEDQTIRLWDVETGQCMRVLRGHTERICSIALTLHTDANRSENCLLASSSDDQTIRLWDLKTGQCVRTLQGHTNRIWSIAFNPTGISLPFFSGDTIRSGSEQILASASSDETIRLWDVQTGDCLGLLRVPRPYEGMDITDATGLTDPQKASLMVLGAIATNYSVEH
jgi:WD40 repeat protein